MTSKHTQRKYCGKKLVKRIGDLTNKCFENAVTTVMSNRNIDPERRDSIVFGMRAIKLIVFFGGESPVDNIEEIKEEVDDLYLQLLCSLSSKDIEDILWVNHKKKIKRAPRTVEALTSELTRRSLFDDSLESETNIINGEIPIDNRESTSNKRTPPKKRNKANPRRK